MRQIELHDLPDHLTEIEHKQLREHELKIIKEHLAEYYINLRNIDALELNSNLKPNYT
ncbi:hypothetical protein [Legionella sp. WA2022007384]